MPLQVSQAFTASRIFWVPDYSALCKIQLGNERWGDTLEERRLGDKN